MSLKISNSGFKLPNYWIYLYQSQTGVKLPNITKEAKVRMLIQFNLIKSQVKISDYELQQTMLFMFIHNPLNYSKINNYSLNMNDLYPSYKAYKKWKIDYADAIKEYDSETLAMYYTAKKLNSSQLEEVKKLQENHEIDMNLIMEKLC